MGERDIYILSATWGGGGRVAFQGGAQGLGESRAANDAEKKRTTNTVQGLRGGEKNRLEFGELQQPWLGRKGGSCWCTASEEKRTLQQPIKIFHQRDVGEKKQPRRGGEYYNSVLRESTF